MVRGAGCGLVATSRDLDHQVVLGMRKAATVPDQRGVLANLHLESDRPGFESPPLLSLVVLPGPCSVAPNISFLVRVSVNKAGRRYKFICFPSEWGRLFPRSGLTNNVQASSGSAVPEVVSSPCVEGFKLRLGVCTGVCLEFGPQGSLRACDSPALACLEWPEASLFLQVWPGRPEIWV